MRDYGIQTGVRLSKERFDKLNRLAESLNVSRNKMMALLIDGAELEQNPVLTVGVPKTNRHDAQNVVGTGITAVGE